MNQKNDAEILRRYILNNYQNTSRFCREILGQNKPFRPLYNRLTDQIGNIDGKVSTKLLGELKEMGFDFDKIRAEYKENPEAVSSDCQEFKTKIEVLEAQNELLQRQNDKLFEKLS